MPLKVTTWNLEHSDRLISGSPASEILDRRRRVRETLEDVDPDILCIQEDVRGEQAIADFAAQILSDAWSPALLRQSGEPSASATGSTRLRARNGSGS